MGRGMIGWKTDDHWGGVWRGNWEGGPTTGGEVGWWGCIIIPHHKQTIVCKKQPHTLPNVLLEASLISACSSADHSPAIDMRDTLVDNSLTVGKGK